MSGWGGGWGSQPSASNTLAEPPPPAPLLPLALNSRVGSASINALGAPAPDGSPPDGPPSPSRCPSRCMITLRAIACAQRNKGPHRESPAARLTWLRGATTQQGWPPPATPDPSSGTPHVSTMHESNVQGWCAKTAPLQSVRGQNKATTPSPPPSIHPHPGFHPDSWVPSGRQLPGGACGGPPGVGA